METQAEGSSGGLRTTPWDGIFARLARRMFSSCERANGFFTLRIHMRGKVAKKIYEQVCPTPLPKPPNAKNRQTSVSSHRTHATLPRIQLAFRNMRAIQIRMHQMREKPVHQLRASLPQSANFFLIVAATVVLWSASV
jgi:hypothetical protein